MPAATDMLMMFKNGSTAIVGEGQSEIDTKDEFTKDFENGKFLEIDDFDFGIDAVDSDSSATSPTLTQGQGAQTTNQTKPKSGRFSKWISGTGVSGQSGAIYPIQMEPFSFSRLMDVASIDLFYNCFNTKSYDTAVLVRRKVGGLQMGTDGRFDKSSNIAAVPYLRIDFTSVLIVAIDWDGGDTVKEKVKFVCRTIKVSYRQQMFHGKAPTVITGGVLSLVKASSGGS
jgi:type VI protein secretion system component Hcp